MDLKFISRRVRGCLFAGLFLNSHDDGHVCLVKWKVENLCKRILNKIKKKRNFFKYNFKYIQGK